ncbi:hypothetical protein B1R38_06090 [Bacillus cereus]|uniref:phospholipase D-like domain-containing protein n=1 Tax=Bacillus cereus TaxID=1396 RepID=UPI000D65DE3F|nr:phospholipase D-like domain-containing protein [Bacillus cereus]PWE74351.1 hypothetical protein B1R38_06090 [Bacillus cereus]
MNFFDKNDVFFDNISNVIISELKKANTSVKIAVAWLNIESYFRIFEELLERKVKLKIILSDNLSNRRHSALTEELSRMGAKVYYIKMPNKFNHMHHKFCIIDNKTVLCGSYNWTKNAENNFENLFVLRDNRLIIQKLKSEFKSLKQMSENVIKNLQKLCKCDRCKGKLFNLLVLIPTDDIYHSMNVSLLQVCSDYPEEHFRNLSNDILTDNTYLELISLLEEFENKLNQERIYIESEYESELEDVLYRNLDFKVSEFLKVRKSSFGKKVNIHSVGILRSEPFGTKGDSISSIKIYWKDKFVSSQIDDEYNTFDLV